MQDNLTKMDFKLFTVPNLITSFNITCGMAATLLALVNIKYMVISAGLIFIAAIFDFLDGMSARLLKSFSPIGKDLDSLADVISFGIAPAAIVFHLLLLSQGICIKDLFTNSDFLTSAANLAIPAMLVVFSALRLAKFNIDTRQSDSFIGLPTPANAMMLASFPVILFFYPQIIWIEKTIMNPWFLVGISIFESFMLISEFPMFSLKFKNMKLKYNKIRFIFLFLAFIAIIILKIAAIPVIIILFIVVSLISNFFTDSLKQPKHEGK